MIELLNHTVRQLTMAAKIFINDKFCLLLASGTRKMT